MAMISMKGCYTIKPAEETPNINISATVCDQIHPITHTPTIYFYRQPKDGFSFASSIETLKTSLSKVLVHFYPLAGRLHWIDGGRLEIKCNSMGAQLYEAESDWEVDNYGDFMPTPELRQLIPFVDYDAPIHELPLLLVQLTKFRCGGMSLGLAFSHTMGDGAGALHFVTEWARIARCESLGLAPFLDRTTAWHVDNNQQTTLPQFDPIEFNPMPLLIGQSDNMEERKKETSVVMVRLTKTQIEKLKTQANSHGYNNNYNDRPFSRYEVVTGHIWRCTCKAREHQSEQITNLRVDVDCRNRLSPPLPKGYFGNAVIPTVATSRAKELLSESLGYASSKIREAIAKMTNEYARSCIDFLRTQPDLSKFRIFQTVGSANKGPFFGNPNLHVTSWIGLQLCADFGWGKEIYMGPGALGFDGKCTIIPSSGDGDDHGSLVVVLRLQVRHLDSFKKFFYEDIDNENLAKNDAISSQQIGRPILA